MKTKTVILLAILQRICFLLWGLYQDSTMELRFTDIDYFVFTDAARFVAEGGPNTSPYDRATYRYTPILSWMLVPSIVWFGAFGKVIFSIGDIIAGYLIIKILRQRGLDESKAVLYASTWLLNPMVSTISTRGSSEGLLGAIVMLFLWATCNKKIVSSGLIAGFAVHFKIYPIIYIPTVLWWLDGDAEDLRNITTMSEFVKANRNRFLFAISSLLSFSILTGAMYLIYGYPFLLHSYLHHLSRVDHRHNFSPYSTFLYMWSSPPVQDQLESNGSHILGSATAIYAFIPQLFLSGIAIPLTFARKDIVKTLFLQTFAFVTFNKVCTSQYFMWYMVLLPFYIESLIKHGKIKVIAVWLSLWIISQVAWIRMGYILEFLGVSTFYPGLFWSTIAFFLINCWGIGIFIDCFGVHSQQKRGEQDAVSKRSTRSKTDLTI